MAGSYLTTGQAARLLGVSKGTILNAVEAGELRAVSRKPGGAFRFLIPDVERYARWRAFRHQVEARARAALPAQAQQATAVAAASKESGVEPLATQLARLQQEQTLHAEAMAAVGAALAGTLDLEELYRLILDQVSRVLPYDHAAVLLYRDGWVTVAGSRGRRSLPIGTRVFRIGDIAYVAAYGAEGRPALIRETAALAHWVQVPPFVGEHAIRSLLVVPLLVEGRQVGTFNVDSFTPNFYTEQHLATAVAFGERAVQALRNARLYELERERALAAEELARVRAEQALEAQVRATLSVALAGTLASEQVYQVILDEAARLLPFHMADIFLYEEGWIVVAASAGDLPLAIGMRLVPLDGSVRCWLPPSADVSYLPDADEEPLWRHIPPRVGERRIRSHISMPFTFDGVQVGCFTIGSYTPHAYSERHMRLASAFGERAAQALRNARLHESERARARAAEELVRVREAAEAALRESFEQAALGMAHIGLDGRYLRVNAALCRLLGYSADELLARRVQDVTAPEDRAGLEARYVQVRAGSMDAYQAEKRYLHKDGHSVWAEINITLVRDADGCPLYVLNQTQDISARKAAEEALQRAAAENALLAAAVENTTMGVVVTDPRLPDNPIVYVNQAYLQLTGYEAHEVLGRNPRLLQGPETSSATRQALREAVAAGMPFAGTILNYRKDGTPMWNEVRITPIRDTQGTVCHWVGAKTDMTEHMRLQAELERLALHDHLTGLPNRPLLLDRAAQTLLQADRDQSRAALLLLDLDHFKEVNDTFGHAVGDVLLQYVGARLAGAVRATDTVARLGGDEFIVLLPMADGDGALRVAATLQRALSEPVVLDGRALRPTGSIGIALYPEHGADAASLIQHADVAMYQAKRERHAVMLYVPEQDLHSPERAAFREEVREAVGRGQLCLHYQPLMKAMTGQVAAVEALVRWQHRERGLLTPDSFLPLLEGLGLQREVTRWVLAEGLRQQRAWRARGIDLTMNINLAALDLQDEALHDEIVQVVATPEQAPRLCLELTEGALVGDVLAARSSLLRLASVGIQVAIDDFGTGHSSLARLARLPVDELKIDRQFVQAMLTNRVDGAIVASTIGLAHSVGVRVVAEGVEDAATLAQLQELGCDLVQGYYISRPLPPEDLLRWLEAR